jgi:hypothetical protein
MRARHPHPLGVVILLALLLFATSGPSIAHMTCLAEGHSTLSMGLMADCCPEEEHEGPTLAPLCCDFGMASSPVDELIPAGGHEQVVLLSVASAHGWAAQSGVRSVRIPWLATRPPPEDPVHRLSRLSIWRI